MDPFRIAPKMGVTAYETYGIVAPKETHTRPATCREVECVAHLQGWRTTIDVSTELGARQASYIRLMSGRHFTAQEAGGLVYFTFPAGQSCFREHRISLERDPLFYAHGGDFRGVTTEVGTYRPDDWVDKMANHQDKIIEAIERG